jgi:hypothetical protein
LNVKISIDQQQRNPEYSLDHSKKKKTSKNYHPALKKEPNITEYGLDASLRCDWAGGHEMLPAPS